MKNNLQRLQQIRDLRLERARTALAGARGQAANASQALSSQLEQLTVTRCDLYNFADNAFDGRRYEGGANVSGVLHALNDHETAIKTAHERALELAYAKHTCDEAVVEASNRTAILMKQSDKLQLLLATIGKKKTSDEQPD